MKSRDLSNGEICVMTWNNHEGHLSY